MKFTDFKNRTEVIEKFNLDFENRDFVKEISFEIDEYFRKRILKNFIRPGVFGSEYSICEAIIYPIISEVADIHNLPIWSHFRLTVPELDLSGEPDYMLALTKKGDEEYKQPIVCLGEAKKDDFVSGWAQVSAEMVAVQKLNGNTEIPIYGLVTTGKVWDFAMLKGTLFTFNREEYIAPKELNTILNILNYLFCEARKNADILDGKESE